MAVHIVQMIHMTIPSGQCPVYILDLHFRLENFSTVQTILILSGQFQYCPDGFNTLQTISDQMLTNTFVKEVQATYICHDLAAHLQHDFH